MSSFVTHTTQREDSGWIGVFLDWLESESEDLVEQMFAAVVRSTPVVVADGADDVRRLREALTSHLPLVYTTLAEGTAEPQLRLPQAAGRWARHLAVTGVDMAELVMAYDAAGDVLLRSYATHLRSVVSGSDRADALEVALERLFGYVRAAAARAGAIYAQERELLERRDTADLHAVVTEVLGGSCDETYAERRLGYRFTASHVGFVLWGQPSLDSDLDRMAGRVRAATSSWQLTSVRTGPAVLQGWLSSSRDVAESFADLVLPDGVRIAFGTSHDGIAGFRATCREAQETYRLADLVRGSSPVLGFDEVALLALARQDTGLACPWAANHLGALLDPAHAELLGTLRVWLDELGSPTRTARRLQLHPNTVVKRLERVERLLPTPLDPSSLVLRTAVELAPLAGVRD